MKQRRLLNTKEAAELTGLSQYELRMGYKAGKYPALEVGSLDNNARRLRWNPELLQEAIDRHMTEGLRA